jgi:hypothetical protein
MLEFVDSRVIIASSQDNRVVSLSSPPKIGWIILRRLKDVKERVSKAETIIKKAVKDKGKEAWSNNLLKL